MNSPSQSPWPAVGRFVVLAYAVSWSAWGALIVLGSAPDASLVGGGLWVLGGFGPTISALVVRWRAGGRDGARELLRTLTRWRREARWYLAAIGFPVAVAVLTLAGGLATGAVAAADVDVTSLWLVLPLFVTNVIIGGGLGEELGWRGYALPRLQRRYSALASSLLLGGIWAAWHLPLFAVPGTVQTDWPVAWFLAMGFGLSVVFTWLYNGTRGSVLLVVFLHAAFNASLSGVWLAIGDVQTGLARWAVLAVLGAAVLVVAASGMETLSTRADRWTESPADAPTVSE